MKKHFTASPPKSICQLVRTLNGSKSLIPVRGNEWETITKLAKSNLKKSKLLSRDIFFFILKFDMWINAENILYPIF